MRTRVDEASIHDLFFFITLKPRVECYTKSMSLKYEPALEPLHISKRAGRTEEAVRTRVDEASIHDPDWKVDAPRAPPTPVWGLRFYGLWFMVYGLWFMVYGL